MGQGTYKVGEAIEVTYQAKGATSGLADVILEIYDEAGAKDIPTFPDVTMTEIGSTGRYYGMFTPDAVGVWKVLIDSVTASGKMVKQFEVVSHNIDSIGDAVDSVRSTVEGITSRPILG